MVRVADIIEPAAKLNWVTSTPTEPGYYWIAEEDEPSHLVRVDIVSDSQSMFQVTLLDDDHKYPIDMWPEAMWCGPLKHPEYQREMP